MVFESDVNDDEKFQVLLNDFPSFIKDEILSRLFIFRGSAEHVVHNITDSIRETEPAA